MVWFLSCFIVVCVMLIALVIGAQRRARQKRLDANTLYNAERIVECGYRPSQIGGRCIKLRGHVEAGDVKHMYYDDVHDDRL